MEESYFGSLGKWGFPICLVSFKKQSVFLGNIVFCVSAISFIFLRFVLSSTLNFVLPELEMSGVVLVQE